MSTLAVCVLVCAIVALAGAADVPEVKRENVSEKEKSHLVKRSIRCYGGWTAINGRCFRYFSRPLPWARAERNCQSLGGNLASVHSILDYHEIQRLILTATHQYKEAWLGGSDAQDVRVWLWTNGKPFNYGYWCPGEPNNGAGRRQRCLQMNYGGQKCMDDDFCHYYKPSVCVKSP